MIEKLFVETLVSNESAKLVPQFFKENLRNSKELVPTFKDLTTSDKLDKTSEDVETKLPIQNKIDGLQREAEVLEDLKKQYPEKEGYSIESEVYLRDENGKIVKDPVTGEARRIDFVVVKDGQVVDSIEVTSRTADKTEQSQKENRIRANGGNYIKDSNGNLVEIPTNIQTRIERRD